MDPVDLQMFSLMDQMDNNTRAKHIKFSDFRKSSNIYTQRGDDLSKSKLVSKKSSGEENLEPTHQQFEKSYSIEHGGPSIKNIKSRIDSANQKNVEIQVEKMNSASVSKCSEEELSARFLKALPNLSFDKFNFEAKQNYGDKKSISPNEMQVNDQRVLELR